MIINKAFVTFVVIALLIVVAGVGYFLWQVATTRQQQLIGGQKDAHGCLVAAGYSWCDQKQQCIRPWEQYCTSAAPTTTTFTCDGSKSITATFYPTDDKYVDLVLSDGRKLSVPHAVSASGARYAKSDESFVFWNKGTTAFITENGQTTFANCAIQGTKTPPVAQTISDGTITVTYNQNFGMATNPQQILTKSYIPPCDPNFNYCLYYNADTYKGTNFESAGLRIKKRADLTSQTACLTMPPTGFTLTPNNTTTKSTYAASVFRNVGQGAAGHLSSGSLYRLFIPTKRTCYEFETRVGQSNYGNYPPGSIQQFTTQDEQQVSVQLMNILESTTLPNGTVVQYPK